MKPSQICFPKYVVISPVRDEEAYLPFTIESMLAQTVRPSEWIIVDDGSADRTTLIAQEYADRFPWIRVARRENRGFRSGGGGIEGFLHGLTLLHTQDWEFLVNLDGDVAFSPDYFQSCFAKFRDNPRLGIGGGTIYNNIDGKLYAETCAEFHVRGATKIYRRRCWDDLGGMVPGIGWDTVDEIKAQMHGWITQSFSDLQVIHHRWTGAARGLWANGVKNGHSDYFVGYHPVFFAAKCLSHLFKRPFIIRGASLAYGFFSGYFQRAPRINDREFIRFLRHQQLRRLFRRAGGDSLLSSARSSGSRVDEAVG
jgi:glycosyltransferase involved in cell wall biosynthesis